MPQRFTQYRLALGLSVLIILPLGYIVRFAANEWINDFLGSVAYEIFWVLLVAMVLPVVDLGRVAIAVLLATCVLEFLQLWQNPVYVALKSTLIGRLILGNVFAWSDFPSYFVGVLAGWAWGRSLQKWLAPKTHF